MRRASFTPAFKLSVDEPLIVVDETDELEASTSGGRPNITTAIVAVDGCSSTSKRGGGGLTPVNTSAAAAFAGGNNVGSSDDDENESPTNPYLLSPFRDPRETRKHSLPNIQITDGIKASQVRRLSDGGENAPTAQEAAFLAQLSQVTVDGDAGDGSIAGDGGAAGGFGGAGGAGGLMVGGRTGGGSRRHSIVTISKVPPILFGRNRRESFAAFASGGEW